MKKENKKLNKEDLRKKYGDVKVMGVPAEIVKNILTKTFTPSTRAITTANVTPHCVTRTPLLRTVAANLQPKLRYEAELDPTFKQVIPYVIVRYQNKIFCTHRLNGDARLVGAYSIGTGGHIDEGEDITAGLTREVKEEIGISPEDWLGYISKGFILDETTAVNSVHLGIVFDMVINRDDIECLEKDKLAGEWMTVNQLHELYEKDKLESWSRIVCEELLFKGKEV